MTDKPAPDRGGGADTPRRRSLFRKGRSGNPKGRPKGTRKLEPTSPLDPILEMTFSVTRDGREVALTTEEALDQKLLEDAIKGDRRAEPKVIKMVDRWLSAKAEAQPRPEPPERPFGECEPRGPTAKAFMDALIALDVIRMRPLHPTGHWSALDDERVAAGIMCWSGWAMTSAAVQAALDRRGQPDAEDLATIRRNALDPDAIWPMTDRDGDWE